MKLKGTVEIEESDYKRSLELAFIDYLDEGIESERDAAFDDAYMTFPDCYIEPF